MSTLGLLAVLASLGGGSVADTDRALPVHEVPSRGPQSPRLAFLITGDGGWAGIDKAIAATLADSGVAVVALDARSYLGTRRTAERVADDVAVVLRRYLAGWGRERLILIGYSRGATVMPFVANRLPPDLAGRVDLVAMFGLGYHAGFHVGFTDLLRTTTNDKDPPVRPEIEALGRLAVPMLCVYGESEKESLCRDGADLPMERIGKTGAHHFDGDHRALADAILARLRRG